MTAQEKDRIKCAIRHIQTAVDIDPWAVEIAVEAMEAQLSREDTTSDLISRQEAIEVIEEMQMPIMRSMFPEEQFVFKGMSEALSAIKDLPSAQPERNTGWWLIREGISDAQCSECKMYFRDVYDMDNSDAFCRHCGAKMEGLKVVEDE